MKKQRVLGSKEKIKKNGLNYRAGDVIEEEIKEEKPKKKTENTENKGEE